MTAPHSDAQAAGYAAWWAGLRVQDNPYPYGSDPGNCKAWNAGLAAGRTDQILANRAAAVLADD